MARGNFKQKRGGGRSFSKNLVLDENGTAVSTDKPRRSRRDEEADEDEDSDDDIEEEEEDEEEEEEEEEDTTKAELTRAERKALKKSGKAKADTEEKGDGSDVDKDPLIANPNLAMGKKMNISDLNAPRELTRREREAKEAKDAKARYWKLHEEGKTDQAKADMARLQKIRAEREAAQARRKAEADAKTAEMDAKKKEQAARGKRPL
ncbi:hypothetical protein EUX98_g8811 [Antrodiella citrinella]|uniref:Casein kinase substrate phosphoprotein PP28 domain-containing protein n=1 Tax=Antrodiella citrinella TaxID=2447956 RepID=A0A4S4M2J0_9APHY|nr:hypothetical protein EUX98_g8811 [Antrodiella citrinella]